MKPGDTVRYEAALGPVEGTVVRVEDRLAYVEVDGAEVKIAVPRLIVVATAAPPPVPEPRSSEPAPVEPEEPAAAPTAKPSPRRRKPPVRSKSEGVGDA